MKCLYADGTLDMKCLKIALDCRIFAFTSCRIFANTDKRVTQ